VIRKAVFFEGVDKVDLSKGWLLVKAKGKRMMLRDGKIASCIVRVVQLPDSREGAECTNTTGTRY